MGAYAHRNLLHCLSNGLVYRRKTRARLPQKHVMGPNFYKANRAPTVVE